MRTHKITIIMVVVFCCFLALQGFDSAFGQDSTKMYETDTIEVETETVKEPTTLTKDELTGSELDKTKGKPLAEALKEITGVSTIQTGSSISKPVIHGLHSNRILILNNGVRQEGQQWGFEHAPEIDPFIAKKLTVIKGANSVRYGSDAIGGVILVEPNDLQYNLNKFKGEVNLIGFSNGRAGVISGIFEGSMKQLPNIAFRMQGTLKRAGNISAPDYTLKNTGYEENNFSLGVGYDKGGEIGIEGFYSQFNTKIGIFPGAHIGNLTDLEIAFRRKVPFNTGAFSYDIGRPFQDIHHDLLKVKGYITTGNDTRLTAEYSWQYNERSEFDIHTPNNPALVNQPELFFGITTYTGDVMMEHRNLGPFKGKTGVSFMRQTNLAKGRDFIPNFENYSGGIYAIEQTTLGMLELEAGIRYDYKWQKIYKNVNGNIYSPDFSYSNFSGILGGKYWIQNDMWFSLNLGTAWRPPSVSELFSDGVHHGSASYEIGNESLSPENSYQAIGTFHYDNENNFHAEATLYYNYISDFIYLQPRPPAILTIRGAFPAFYYEQADAEFKGLDADISYSPFPFLTFESKASIVRAFNLSADEYLFLIPADRFENAITFKAGDVSFLKDVSLSFSALNVLKQTRVPANTDYVPPPDGYMLFNTDLEFSVPVGKQDLRFGLSVDNIFNTSYRDYLNRFRYYTDDPGRNITLRLIVPVKF